MRNVITSQETAIPGEDHSLALALVNSRHGHRSGPVEHLAGTDETRRWLTDRNLLDETVAMTETDVAELRNLREAIRELLKARIEQRTPDPTLVREINTAAAAAPTAATLHWTARDQPTRTWTPTPDSSGLDRARALIAADAIGLVCDDRAPALHACGGPGCIRLFLKDHPRRIWCTSRCGERIRATRYYHRHRHRPN